MDKRAKNILFSTYWSSKGWKSDHKTDPEDFLYAKEKGLMFDPITISHDDCVKRILEAADTVTLEQVSKAFLSSLSTCRLDWRSGISSYYTAKQIPLHHFAPSANADYACQNCHDVYYEVIGYDHYVEEDLNVLNFERIKWGGIRHHGLLYILFDLEQFKKEQIPEPTEDDIAIFRSILKAVDSCGAGAYPSALCDKLKEIPTLKSNKAQRQVLVEILACIDVLRPLSYDRPIKGKNDWSFAEYWRGEDGYDEETVKTLFGKYLK